LIRFIINIQVKKHPLIKIKQNKKFRKTLKILINSCFFAFILFHIYFIIYLSSLLNSYKNILIKIFYFKKLPYAITSKSFYVGISSAGPRTSIRDSSNSDVAAILKTKL